MPDFTASSEQGDGPVAPRGHRRPLDDRRHDHGAPVSGTAPRQVVIVGAGASGDAAAEGLRKAGFDGRVVLIGGEPHPAYHRPYLSKEFLRDEVPLERPVV